MNISTEKAYLFNSILQIKTCLQNILSKGPNLEVFCLPFMPNGIGYAPTAHVTSFDYKIPDGIYKFMTKINALYSLPNRG